MANFYTLQKLEEKITDIIFNAKKTLLILSPYIKLDDYFKRLFSNHSKNPEVHIIVVFGKNEDNKGKSLGKDDFEFFKQFPKISILYLKDLHAKYYANESEGIVTSINLHDYSFKNNIEFGIHSKNPETSILGLATIRNPIGDKLDSTAWEYAFEFMLTGEAVFIKRPVIQKKFLGLSTNHMGSEVLFDNTEFFTKRYGNKEAIQKRFDDFPEFIEFGKPTLQEKPKREEIQGELGHQTAKPEHIPTINYQNTNKVYNNNNQQKNNYNSNYTKSTAFCIRTGERIKYSLNYPFSDSAYNSWKQWRNEDYIENYCHSCGKPHPTTKKKPLCESCFYN